MKVITRTYSDFQTYYLKNLILIRLVNTRMLFAALVQCIRYQTLFAPYMHLVS